MYRPEDMSFDTRLAVTNERFTELVKKETQLELIKKLIASKGNYADIFDIKLLLDIEMEDIK